MIEVIKRGTRRRIFCPECGSTLAFWESDVKYSSDYHDENPRYINCPVCKSDITVPEVEEENECTTK